MILFARENGGRNSMVSKAKDGAVEAAAAWYHWGRPSRFQMRSSRSPGKSGSVDSRPTTAPSRRTPTPGVPPWLNETIFTSKAPHLSSSSAPRAKLHLSRRLVKYKSILCSGRDFALSCYLPHQERLC